MKKLVALVVALCCVSGGYFVADVYDRVPGFFTLKPLENEAQPYPSVADASPAALAIPDPAHAAVPDSAAVHNILTSWQAHQYNVGTVGGIVLDAVTGTELGSINSTTGLLPASTMKILTSYAVLATLGGNATLNTRALLSGTDLYLVGGGDILLSEDAGDPSQTIGHAGIGDLARAAAGALQQAGVTTVSVHVDTSRYSGPEYHPDVLNTDKRWVLPSSPLAVGYSGSAAGNSNPAGRAVVAFVSHLQAAGIDAVVADAAVAPSDAAQIASVASAPIRDLVDHTLLTSDNSVAQILQNEVAVAGGDTGAFETGSKAVTSVLSSAGFNLEGVRITDGSGLTMENRVTPQLLAQVLSAIWACSPSGGIETDAEEASSGVDSTQALGGKRETCATNQIGAGMPLAGVDGTLEHRMEHSAATGRVHAKTGTLDAGRSLAGYVYTSQGRPLVFVLIANAVPGNQEGAALGFNAAIDSAVEALAAL